MKPFSSKIYKAGINAVADVPEEVTALLRAEKGYIRVTGTINGFAFKQTLVPVKNGPYRLYVNIPMLKGGKAAIGQTAEFLLEQDLTPKEDDYPMNEMLLKQLKEKNLTGAFDALSTARRKDILKYLNYLKTEDALKKNIDKVVAQLENQGKDVRVP